MSVLKRHHEQVAEELAAKQHVRLMDGAATLRKQRERAEMSYRTLARYADVSSGYVWQLEQCWIKEPDPHKLLRIAKVLGVDPDQFLGIYGLIDPSLAELLACNAERIARDLRAAHQ